MKRFRPQGCGPRAVCASIVVVAGWAPQGAGAADSPELSFELGAAWQQRNDVQISNEPPNTRFALDSISGSGPFFGGRLMLVWPLTERQQLRFLYAPLRIDESGTTAAPIVFQGSTFNPGAIDTKYRFDSWRVSWRWRFHESARWTWNAGATLNAGYRFLDGGADNDELYTFARFDQAVLGASWKFR